MARLKNGTPRWPREVSTLQSVLKHKCLSANGDVMLFLDGYSKLQWINRTLAGGIVNGNGNYKDYGCIFYVIKQSADISTAIKQSADFSTAIKQSADISIAIK